METVSRRRVFDASADAVRDAIGDVDAFMRAAGFDEVRRDGDTITLSKALGLLKVKLVVRLLDEEDAALAYEQLEGIFSEMITRYTVEPVDGGVEVVGTTSFEIDAAIAGSMLDATIVSRQRGRELDAQLDHLESIVEE
jgi:hypothetical protein